MDCTVDPGLDPAAWYCGNSSDTPHPVGEKIPNFWGLYDMLGNVYEAVWDWYEMTYPESVIDPEGPAEGSNRIGRGGGWNIDLKGNRCADRVGKPPDFRRYTLGFRIARTLN